MTSLICRKLPASVRYVKNGEGGCWWRAAKRDNQVHVGWSNVPKELLLEPDFARIEQIVRAGHGARSGATQNFNQLRAFLDAPSGHVWITFEDGCMWWCTVLDGAVVNPDGESAERGHFWLVCAQPWSDCSLKGTRFAIEDLPGTVTQTAGFKGTECTPSAWPTVLRLIQDERDPDAVKATAARGDYERAVEKLVARLSPQDFELLIDLILSRTGWARISRLGGPSEGFDIEAKNPATDEIAFVQVKSAATQETLNKYMQEFSERRDRYARMVFAVHSPRGTLTVPGDLPAVKVWTPDHIAKLVVRVGLGEWVGDRLA